MGYLCLARRLLLLAPLLVPAGVLRASPEGDPRLASVEAAHAQRGSEAARQVAREHRIRVRDDGTIPVVLEPHPGQHSRQIDLDPLPGLGGRVERAERIGIRVSVPPDSLARLRSLRGVGRVRLPFPAIPAAGSLTVPGVAMVGASELHDLGVIGAGIAVAVVDSGFLELAQVQAAGDLPLDLTTVDFTGLGLGGTSDHGTAVAEHVYDMAPGASLHLLNVADDLDLAAAAFYLKSAGIKLANLSLAFSGASYYDGTGPISQIVDDSRSIDRVFWSVAAGNWAQKHWRGTWTDTDGDNWLEFAGGDERITILNTLAQQCTDLNWNQYGVPASQRANLDLYVFGTDGSTVGSSTFVQGKGSSLPPFESACFSAVPGITPYEIGVRRVSGSTSGLNVTLFNLSAPIEHAQPGSSFLDPAPAAGAFTVGAIGWSNWPAGGPIESFSSQGPTNDGRVKPDLVGPDSMNTVARLNAWGTSFASPMVAGAAALILQQDPSLTPEAIASELEQSAVDVGAPGKDVVYGSGQLQVRVLPQFDFDGDGAGHADDNCRYIANDQSDTGGVSSSGPDGIGDACQCGDVDGNGTVNDLDRQALRAHRGSGIPLPEPALCNVRGPADGGATDCDLLDLVVLSRALLGLEPGIGQVCSPALPPPL
jgi:subtilisin family serine protease